MANPLDLSTAVRAEVDKMNETLPEGMKLVVAYDTSVFIERSIKSVFDDDRRGDRAGRACDLLLPAQLARNADSDRDDPACR